MRRVPGCIANNEIKGMGPSQKSFGNVYGYQLNSHLPMHLTPPPPHQKKEPANTVLSNAKQKEMSPVISGGVRGELGWALANISKQMFTNRR